MDEKILFRFLAELDQAAEFARMNDSCGIDRYAAVADIAEALRNALRPTQSSGGSEHG